MVEKLCILYAAPVPNRLSVAASEPLASAAREDP